VDSANTLPLAYAQKGEEEEEYGYRSCFSAFIAAGFYYDGMA
jgi:hypothetical protein